MTVLLNMKIFNIPSELFSIIFSHLSIDDINISIDILSKWYNKRDLIPAVCHIDGTGRLQTVRKVNNKKYYFVHWFKDK